MDGDGPIFVTGPDRSGKTRLRQALGAHPDLHLARRTALWTGDGDLYVAVADPASLARRLDWLRSDPRTGELVAEADGWQEEFGSGPPTASRLYAALYAARARSHGKRRWGEQDAEVERHADRLLRMLPSARIVHLVRDPRDRYAAVVAGERRRAGRLGSLTASWIASARRGEEHAARYPRQYRLVRADDLDHDPRAEMERLHEFLGLKAVPDILDGWSTKPVELPELRRAEVTFIEAWAGATMRTMGYRAVGRRTSLAAWLPVEVAGFAARSLREARSGMHGSTSSGSEGAQ
jgi:hypothetical protein